MVTQRWWTINTCWDCCCCSRSLSLSLSPSLSPSLKCSAVWTSPLLAGTPNPLRPAFSRTRWSDSTGASTHLTVIQLSFCHSWNGDISFKICYSVASLTPPHTAFCFYFLERKKKKARAICVHVPCHLGHTCQTLICVSVLVWMVNRVQSGGFWVSRD